MSLYMMCVYGDTPHSDWFRKAWTKTGKKLDMGKACIRFKKVEDLALDVIAEAIRMFRRRHTSSTAKRQWAPSVSQRRKAVTRLVKPPLRRRKARGGRPAEKSRRASDHAKGAGRGCLGRNALDATHHGNGTPAVLLRFTTATRRVNPHRSASVSPASFMSA